MPMMRLGIEELDHTADVGIRLRAMDLSSLFLYAATGMFSLIHDDIRILTEDAAKGSGHASSRFVSQRENKSLHTTDRTARTADITAAVIAVDASRLDQLLHGWLTELLFHHSIQHSLPRAIAMEKCDAGQLRAHVEWVHMDAETEADATEIKAVTWHGLTIEEHDGIWTAEVIFDT